MPTYRFLNNQTGEEFEDFMSISSMEEYLKTNLHITQLVNGAPLIHSGRGMGKPDQGFRDLLKDIKKTHSKGFTKSTINNF
jgi:hypothetical protein